MMSTSSVPPSIELNAFTCPHCSALTTQHWHAGKVAFSEKNKTPMRIREPVEFKKSMLADIDDPEKRVSFSAWVDKIATGLPSVGDKGNSFGSQLHNVDVSECYHCGKLAIWVGDAIVWPRQSLAVIPNADLPEDIVTDFREAGQIVEASPRGAAALLRLCIQKLCKHLGEPGKNINNDIGALVKRGLDVRVQQALDVLRVFGNSAVHPGEIDLHDDRASAEKLFELVNMIADIMISQPKAIGSMYDRIGSSQRAAIEKRDGK